MSVVYRAFPDIVDPDSIPFGGLLAEALDGLLIGPLNISTDGVRWPLFVQEDISFTAPGLDFITFAVGAQDGGTALTASVDFSPVRVGVRDVPLTMSIANDVVRQVKPDSWDVLTDEPLTLTLGRVDLMLGSDGAPSFDLASGLALPRCRLGDLPVVISATDVRWCAGDVPSGVSHAPPDFIGLYLHEVAVELVGVGKPGVPVLRATDFLIGTGGITGRIDLTLPGSWDGSRFSGPAATDILGFQGCLTGVRLALDQSAVTECDIRGDVLLPYLDQVAGLTLGFGHQGVTAVARTPTCTFTGRAATRPRTTAGPSGYLLTVPTSIGILDLNRVEMTLGAQGASVSLGGRLAITAGGLDIPPVAFKGLRIGTDGRVAVEGGWLDVDSARTASLKGFPLHITKVGFGAEADGRRWVGLNGAVRLPAPLPAGASVEGLRLSWDPAAPDGDVRVRLGGIGVELTTPGTFSLKGGVAFFDNDRASGFRGSVKLELTTLRTTVDAGIMVGRTTDGTAFFFLHLDVELPAGIALFSTGAAIYGFSGLLAVNLRPDRHDGEHWYHGYYRRTPAGVTTADKWAVEQGAFAIGLGVKLGSLPDLAYSFNAKVLLVLVLPGPQILLNGRGGFLKKAEEGHSASGLFEALLVLDVPGRLFQANLSAEYRMPAEDPTLLDVSGGVDVAFTWADSPPADLWHIYLGEGRPAERRIRAALLKVVKGDTWLMVNRPRSLAGLKTLDPDRLGEFEIGGSVVIGGDWRFGPVRAWLQAGMDGVAGVTLVPQHFEGGLRLWGGAGVSAFCIVIEVGVQAKVEARAPTPWWLYFEVRASIKIDLFFVKFERSVTLPWHWGDESEPLPEPVSGIVRLSVEHSRADEDRPLQDAVVPADAHPLITFDRPVHDGAHFGSPGPVQPVPDRVGARAFSYELRHLVLVTDSGRLVGAAGQVRIDGSTATFPGLSPTGPDALPDLAESMLTLVDDTFTERGTYRITGGRGATAMFPGTPPQGVFGYRLSAPRPVTTVEITAVAAEGDGTAVLTLSTAPAEPSAYAGGRIRDTSGAWPVLAATGTTVRIRGTGTLPATGPAGLEGPDPAVVEACWAATTGPGDPAGATRLSVGARTPFAYYRRNDIDSVRGLDPFTGPYACGPDPVEEPLCLDLTSLPDGPLAGDVSLDGVPATATGTVRAAGGQIRLGAATGGSGTLILRFDPPVDQLWIGAAADEFGRLTARRGGTEIRTVQLDRRTGLELFSGGVDELHATGTLCRIDRICYLPGWTCTGFEESNFPQGRTGVVSYAGLELRSPGRMIVEGGTLTVGPSPRTGPIPDPRRRSVLTVVLPRPATRIRVALDGAATVTAYAAAEAVAGAPGQAGGRVQLVADPHGPAHLGWCDRIVVTAAASVRITGICTDAGPFGWRRYEQWRWSKGIRRTVESLYRPDRVLPPGHYELRVRTATVITGARPDERYDTTRASFTVGEPPGFPAEAAPRGIAAATYPHGGPLTELATYTAGTFPPSGSRPWYRSLDTGVAFTDAHVSRMYLQSGRDLCVVVRDAGGQVVRGPAHHFWSTTEIQLDAWTWEWVRTLNGDGSDPCAQVDLDRVTRPESLLAGGEMLRPGLLHRCELVAASGEQGTPVYAFEFVTSRFTGPTQHLATFDGRCRDRHPRAELPDVDLASLALAHARDLDELEAVLARARETRAAAHTGAPTTADIAAAAHALAALAERRATLARRSATRFAERWTEWYGGRPPSQLPPGCLLTVTALPGPHGGDVLVLESPEPFDWDRIRLTATAHDRLPAVRASSVPTRAFGRPDAGFDCEDGGLLWHAGVELWVRDGAVRAREDDKALDVRVEVGAATDVMLVLDLKAGSSASVSMDPPRSTGTRRIDAPVGGGRVEVPIAASADEPVRSVQVAGLGVGVVQVDATRPFVPREPRGELRITDVVLPTVAQPTRHHVTLIALAPVPSLEGWTLVWSDPFQPGTPVLYARLPAIGLADGRRLRLFPGLTDAPVLDEALVSAGGPGEDPPPHGAVVRLVDPSGHVVHETAALADASAGAPRRVVAVPDPDGARALLLPADGRGFEGGWWTLHVEHLTDAGPDRTLWTVAGRPTGQITRLRFSIGGAGGTELSR
ncbi:MAG: hypothetical protein HOZ81_45400 [Streptomyces sp.]|nr:hypothetical protein [Streptomyces sp.]